MRRRCCSASECANAPNSYTAAVLSYGQAGLTRSKDEIFGSSNPEMRQASLPPYVRPVSFTFSSVTSRRCTMNRIRKPALPKLCWRLCAIGILTAATVFMISAAPASALNDACNTCDGTYSGCMSSCPPQSIDPTCKPDCGYTYSQCINNQCLTSSPPPPSGEARCRRLYATQLKWCLDGHYPACVYSYGADADCCDNWAGENYASCLYP